MRNLRIAHIADTHLGYRSSTIGGRDDDFAKSWATACRAIVDSAPDLILHAGDVFHRPNPSWNALSDFLDGAAILGEAKVPTFMISGNHDCSRVRTKHTVFSVLTEVTPFITISYDAEPKIYRIDRLDTEVVLLSHQALLSPWLQGSLELSFQSLGTLKYKILVAHGDVYDLEKAKELGGIVIPDFVFDYPWSYVALGHLHVAQPYGKTGWYSGSIERCGWSDYPAQPGWTLATLPEAGAVRHEQRELPHLPMIQLPDLLCSEENAVDIGAEVLRGLERAKVPNDRAVARIKLDGVHLFARRSLQTLLQRLVRENYPKLLFQVAVDSASSVWSDPLEAPQENDLQSVEDMFRDFVGGKTFDDPEIGAKLLETGLDAFSKVRSTETNHESL